MYIERTDDEVIIRIPATVKTTDLQEVINFIRYKELTAKVKVPQNIVDELAREVNKKWWAKNKKRFLSGK